MKRAKILSASAGSGKTYQLALKYICDVIENPELYRNILAVTFTNKATEEMKSRILNEIHTLAAGKKSKYLDEIIKALGLSEQQIRDGALKARTRILHDYSRFSVLTIDRFYQRILRAFIKELGLDLSYNLEIDADLIIERSVDKLIDNFHSDATLRRWMLDYAEERLMDGNEWNMRKDLRQIGAELFKENGAKKMREDIDKDTLRNIMNRIEAHRDKCHEKLQNLGQQCVDIMSKYGVQVTDFKQGNNSFAKSLIGYANGDTKATGKIFCKAMNNIDECCSKKPSANATAAASELHPLLQPIYELQKMFETYDATMALLHMNYRTFALIGDLKREAKSICDAENTILLSNTKDILAKFIDDNNAPFIYEKVGNRYDHYMIDEFQDTSVREWNNMLPLLKEALDSNPKASIFIVGDIKQSIYRWRGGSWRLLGNDVKNDLGHDEIQSIPLKKNYRSLGNVIKFNNSLIKNAVSMVNQNLNSLLDEAKSNYKITDEVHSELYDIISQAYTDCEQEIASDHKDSGYVQATLYDKDIYEVAPFIEAIESAKSRGYRYRDMLIVVRNNNEAKSVARELFLYKERRFTSHGEKGFNILIPESLTLESCDVIMFIIAIMRLSINSNNDIERGIYNSFVGHSFDHKFTEEELATLHAISQLSPMEAFETIISCFELHKRKDSIAYIQAMHEQIISFSTARMADIQQYLEWWDKRGKDDSIIVEMTDDTIEITTIHKSKGLERDVVIIPQASWSTIPHHSLNPIVWSETSDKIVSDIGYYPTRFDKMKDSAFSEAYYREYVMYHVDAINLLYVAVTRASRELYIYIPKRLNNEEKQNNQSIIQYVMYGITCVCQQHDPVTDERGILYIPYSYGSVTTPDLDEGDNSASTDILLDCYTTNKPSVKVHFPTHRFAEDGLIESVSSLRNGIMLHDIFAGAATYDDVKEALCNKVKEGAISDKDATAIATNVEEAMQHETIGKWFSDEWDDIKYEADIILKDGTRRPDRVMIKGDTAIVVDYKFGKVKSNNYTNQVALYIAALRDMKCYSNVEGYVWYVALNEVEKAEA